jgi:hypothetical protein
MDTESDFLSEITVRLVVGVVRVGVTGVGLSEWSDCHWTLRNHLHICAPYANDLFENVEKWVILWDV